MNAKAFVWTIAAFCLLCGSVHSAMLATLVSFNNTNGARPLSLLQATDGNFYGLTSDGGGPAASGGGTIFKMTPDGTLTTLFIFSNPTDGYYPEGLMQASDGNFYGCTYWGGSTNQSGTGDGTIFKLGADGSFATLCSFNGTNGANPTAALIEGSDRNLYGSTLYGGIGYNGSWSNGTGTVFRVTTTGLLTTLAYFDAPRQGVQPIGRLTQMSNGDLFGLTRYGGTHTNLYFLGEGTIFKLSTNGALTTLVSFNGTNGSIPSCGLTSGAAGNLYGVTSGGGTGYPGVYSGTAFQVTPEGGLTTLHSFIDGTDGVDPLCEMVQGKDGNFYGLTSQGPTNTGTVFRLGTNGTLTTLYTFSGGNDGYQPSSLILGRDGNLYGTTVLGGANSHGTIFRLNIAPQKPSLQATSLSNGTLTFSWDAESGQNYQLQYTTNLIEALWTDLGAPITATNNLETASDTTGQDQQRFYRVMLVP